MIYVASTCLALAATFLLIGAMLPWLRGRAMARLTHRSSHSMPTPQGAGLAVVAVTLCICGAALVPGWSLGAPPWPTTAAIGVGALLLCGIGMADDISDMPIRLRFAGQAFAVAGLVALFPPDARLFPEVLPLGLERAALALAGLWFVNLFNFMDGIDWIAFVEVTTICSGLCLLWKFGLAGRAAGFTALVLSGATAGFAVWNRPRAAVFLGDAGSLPIGFLLVWLMIDTAVRGAWAAVLLVSLYYWADATVTLLRRILRRERFWTAHREHFYQQATRPGRHGVPRTLASIAVVNALLVALGVGAEVHGGMAVKIAALAIGAGLVGALLGYLRDRRGGKQP